MKKGSIIPGEAIISKIYLIREKKVMLDQDLAELYGSEVKYLKRQVKRNIDRFPVDFMFELTKEEYSSLRCQFGTLEKGAHAKYLPYVFTEHGVLMLANVLKNDQAINVSIKIIEIFVKMREVITSHKELLSKIEQIEKKVTNQDEKVELLFNYVKKFIQGEQDRPKIGYKVSGKTKVSQFAIP